MGTVVLTASAGAFSGLAEALRSSPVELRERPLVSFNPPSDWGQLDEALNAPQRYPTLALTSPRAAMAVAQRVRACNLNWAEGKSPQVWAVGPATAKPLRDLVGVVQQPSSSSEPEQGAAARLAHAMLAANAAGPVLFPCGDPRREELSEILRAHGVRVEEVVCYRALLATPEQAGAALAGADLVVVASPAVLQLLAKCCPPSRRPPLVAIGPTTASAARDAGWEPAAVPETPSTSALASAISGLLTPR
jgi:uroporphyrinogen-III synthase